MKDPFSRLPRSLCFFLQALRDKVVTIELRGSHIARGLLDSVDARMKYVHLYPSHSLLRSRALCKNGTP